MRLEREGRYGVVKLSEGKILGCLSERWWEKIKDSSKTVKDREKVKPPLKREFIKEYTIKFPKL